jgi:DNA (cytosine-5)-methyltransferase 1
MTHLSPNGNGRGPRKRLISRRPIAIDLFSGAGGLSLGLEQAGFDVVASVEYDPVHAAVHEFNFPRTKLLCRDVMNLVADELRAAAGLGREQHGHRRRSDGEIDLIAGGPPCQGFSLIGKRLIDDPRNRLVFHFFRLVTELRPRYFVMENVPGMKIGGHSSILERLVAEFEEAGYRVVKPVETLNAADFGVPQDRPRVFILGARDDQELPLYPASTVLPVGRRVRLPEPGEELEPGPTVSDAIADLPDLDKFPELLEADEVEITLEQLRESECRASGYARRLRGIDRDPLDLGHPRIWPRATLTSSMRTRHTAVSIARFSATRPGDVEPISRFLRPHPDGLCNALRAGTGSERGAYTSPRPIHPFLPRVLSVREAARVHSFPDWFRFHRTKWHGFRQIGNAVAPLVARAVGSVIVEALSVSPPIPTTPVPLGDRSLLGLRMTDAAAYFGADPAAIPPQRTRGGVAAVTR